MPRASTYEVNAAGVAHARELVDANRQPDAAARNAYLERHSWDEYGAWHLAITTTAPPETKARYGFVFGDFRRLHRMGLVACYYRAAEWEHRAIMEVAHELLLYLDDHRRPSR